MRRLSLWWAPVPLIASLAFEAWSILQSPDLPDTAGHWGVIGAMVSAFLWFGRWPRKHWVWAGLGALVAVVLLGWANAQFVVHLHELGGVPPRWLLELNAVLMLLGLPAGLIAGVTSAYVCSKS